MQREMKSLPLITSAKHELLMFIPALLIAWAFIFFAVELLATAAAPVVGPWVDYLHSIIF